MTHTIGTVIICFCVISAGIKRAIVYKRKNENVYLFLRLLRHINNRISENLCSLNKALLSFEDPYYKKSEFYRYIKETDFPGISVFFEKNGDMLFCDNEVTKLLSAFFTQLPFCRTSTECTAICEKYIPKLEKIIAEKKEFNDKKIQLEKTLYFLGAAILFVVLI